MRERLDKAYKGAASNGITPAYAGKTGIPKLIEGMPKDHPRVCGKDLFRGGKLNVKRGSPPRMRERPSVYPNRVQMYGITPAYAGKTKSAKKSSGKLKDHPRVCGKDFNLNFKFIFISGSPPRMRERLKLIPDHSVDMRITPAYAGKTSRRIWQLGQFRDHPRVCGKDQRRKTDRGIKRGSPPRMRERPIFGDITSWPWRITPAYAGKTEISQVWANGRQDHPRVCGKDPTPGR